MTATEALNPQTAKRALEQRVLIAAPTGCDAEILCRILTDVSIEATVCATLEELCQEIERAAAAAVVAEEVFTPQSQHLLAETFWRQPEWSDFPLIVMSTAGELPHRGWQSLNEIGRCAHAILLQRPVRKFTLLSAVRAAIQSRVRQYQMRDELVQRKQIEAALRHSEERLVLAQRAGRVGVFDWDAVTGRVIWTAQQEELFGLAPGTFEGTYGGWAKRIEPEDERRLSPQFVAWRQQRVPEAQFEYRFYWPDGQQRWMEARVSFTYAEDGTPLRMLGTNVDITERKQAEEALREANRRKDEFLATLAHELRNPLAPLRNGLALMGLRKDDPESVEQARAMMERQLAQLVRLIDDLLDVSRISRSKIEVRKERVALATVVQNAVETVHPMIEQARHEFTVDLPTEPIYVDGDVIRLSQALSNLLSNAAKFTEPAGHIWLTVKRQGGEAVVAVRDNGVGIPSPMLSKIFDLFTQVDRSLEKSHSGLGIGLSLVKGLVEMHGGRIEAKSEGYGTGSEFVVRLPLASSLSKEQPGDRRAEAVGHANRHRVLVVDDNRDAAISLAMLLKTMGSETQTAYDGLEALDVAAAFQPDVVVLDLGMPKLNGYDTARRIREQPWGTNMALVALTGWGQKEDKDRSQEAGFDFHMVKPVDPEAFEKLLSELYTSRGHNLNIT